MSRSPPPPSAAWTAESNALQGWNVEVHTGNGPHGFEIAAAYGT